MGLINSWWKQPKDQSITISHTARSRITYICLVNDPDAKGTNYHRLKSQRSSGRVFQEYVLVEAANNSMFVKPLTLVIS